MSTASLRSSYTIWVWLCLPSSPLYYYMSTASLRSSYTIWVWRCLRSSRLYCYGYGRSTLIDRFMNLEMPTLSSTLLLLYGYGKSTFILHYMKEVKPLFILRDMLNHDHHWWPHIFICLLIWFTLSFPWSWDPCCFMMINSFFPRLRFRTRLYMLFDIFNFSGDSALCVGCVCVGGGGGLWGVCVGGVGVCVCVVCVCRVWGGGVCVCVFVCLFVFSPSWALFHKS